MEQNPTIQADTPHKMIQSPGDPEAPTTFKNAEESRIDTAGSEDKPKKKFQDDQNSPDEVNEQLLSDSQPLQITDFFIRHPCKVVLAQIFFLLVLTMGANQLGYFELTPQNNREYLIWSDDRAVAFDKLIVAEEYLLANSGGDGDQPLRMTTIKIWNPMILYEAQTGGNLLLKSNIMKLNEIENNMKESEYWGNVCLAKSQVDPSCADESFTSPLLFMYFGGYTGNIEDATQEQIDTAWNNCITTPEIWSAVQPLVQDKAKIEEQGGKVEHMRSFQQFGFPLKLGDVRYRSLDDRKDDQKAYIAKFQKEVISDFEAYDQDTAELYPTIISDQVTQDAFYEIVEKDTQWAVFSVMFVFIYFIVHLQSLYLSFIGIVVILLSFGFTAIFNEGIIRNAYYSTLHSLVIFIVLGIAADDIFVFIDAWRQSAHIPLLNGDENKRLAYSFRRAGRATFITSSTTSVAFLANVFSPIMPIASFGIYAAVIIAANYLIIIMVFPPTIIFWEHNLAHRNWCCISKNQEKDNENEKEGQQKEKAEEQVNSVELFFAEQWNNTIQKYAYPIIGVFFIWTVIAAIFASQLSPLTKEEDYLPNDHRLMVIMDTVATQYPTGGLIELSIDVFWGVKDLDKEGKSKWNRKWDPAFIGEVIFDDTFDLSPEANQKSLLDLCADLKTQEFVKTADSTKCWTDSFNAYLGQQIPSLAMPLAPETFDAQLLAWVSDPASSGPNELAKQTLGFKNDKLIYMKIYSKAKGEAYDPYQLKNPIYLQWEQYFENYRTNAPEGMKSAIQTARDLWAWLPTEKAFMTSAFQGMTIATIFAFMVLLAATGNIIQAILSLLCVAVVIVSVLAIMQFQGWEIGISECIAMVVLIGFSVDYVVHLSADYMHSAHKSRNLRMKQAYKEMGVSILSGSITTFGSGVFLFGGKVITFNKFAVMITSTISLSFLCAMLLFGAVMHVMGPEEGFGDLPCCKKRQQSKESKQP